MPDIDISDAREEEEDGGDGELFLFREPIDRLTKVAEELQIDHRRYCLSINFFFYYLKPRYKEYDGSMRNRKVLTWY